MEMVAVTVSKLLAANNRLVAAASCNLSSLSTLLLWLQLRLKTSCMYIGPFWNAL